MSRHNALPHPDPLFVQRMEGLLGDETLQFLTALDQDPPVSVLFNAAKSPAPFEGSEMVPWCTEGVYLPARPEYIFDPLFHAGCYYPMEASSMFLAHAIRQYSSPDIPLCALDLCAAPGGKSAIALNTLPAGSLVVANEVIRSRFHTLQYNLDKWGRPNIIRASMDPGVMPWDGVFDLVITDAPCSGEGLYRKDPDTRAGFSLQQVAHCSARQRRILTEAVRLLKPGGLLFYSTCTYSAEENIHQVQWLCAKHGLSSLRIDIPQAWGIIEFDSGAYGYQFYPHRVRGEGFFCALLQKRSTDEGVTREDRKKSQKQQSRVSREQQRNLERWIAPSFFGDPFTSQYMRKDGVHTLYTAQEPSDFTIHQHILPGTLVGAGEANTFTPAHALALSALLHPDVPSMALDWKQAIAFLRKDPLQITCDNEGWHVARHMGFALGWLKQTRSGLKNYFPTKLRIIKQPGVNTRSTEPL